MSSELRQRYRDWKRISKSRRATTYFAVAESGRTVIVKVYRSTRGGPVRARMERDAIRACEHRGTPKIIECVLELDSAALVQEAFSAVPLASARVGRRSFSIDRALSIGISCAEILVVLHAARIVHRGVHPSNVLVDPVNGETFLVGFSDAHPIGTLRSRDEDAADVCGDPAYMAPEQTGRMNRGCDARSDLYGLGGTLYYALTGRAPFESEDRLELLHAHMARVPSPAREVRPEVPAPISRLVEKLLAKQPEERYQSARAVLDDLTELRAQLVAGRVDDRFVLGRTDGVDRPKFTRTLRGRDAERLELERAYALAARGVGTLVWIGGPAGAGKSALVDVLRPIVSAGKGHLAEGKFDLYNDRPYAGWADAFASLTQQMLVESDAALGFWSETLRRALGPIAGALADLSPDLHHVLGDVSPLAPVGPRQTQERLALALERLVTAVATPDHPLVLFLDDVQWSDSGSRFLLEHLLSAHRDPALLVVGAYRDENLENDPALKGLLARLESRVPEVRHISLGPLTSEGSKAMLAEALGHTPEAVAPLAEEIGRKTGNLPLVVREFTEHLCDRRLLRYEPEVGFTWDVDAIAAAGAPDGAVELLRTKIDTLPADVRRVLEAASCVGDHVDSGVLAELSDEPPRALEAALHALCDVGILAPSPDGFRFSHDRLREAAHSGQSEHARSRLHAGMAELLLARLPERDRPARAFELADHLNRGRSVLPEAHLDALVDANLAAGRKALAAGAAVEASHYFRKGCTELTEKIRSRRHAPAFDLLLGLAQSLLLTGDLDGTQRALEQLDGHASTRTERRRAAETRLKLWSLIKPPEECAAYELEVLRSLGVRWPLHPSRFQALRLVRSALRRWNALAEEEIFRRLAQPADTDAPWLDALRLIDAAGACLSRTDGYLVVLASSMILHRSLEAGYVASPAFNLANFALYSHAVLVDGKALERFRGAAETALQQERDPVYAGRTRFTLALVDAWRMSRREAIAPLPEIAEELREAGDLEFAYFSWFQHVLVRILGGDPVESVTEELRVQVERVGRFGHRFPNPEGALMPYRLLSEPDAAELDLDREVTAVESWFLKNPGATGSMTRTLWMMVLCVFGRDDLAFAQAAMLPPDPLRLLPLSHCADRVFYEGLAAASLARSARGISALRYRRTVATARRWLLRFGTHAPDVGPMADLIEAERHTLRGPTARAAVLYDRAAQSARVAKLPHLAAMAHERRSRTLLALNHRTEGMAARARAIAIYREWGASTKARALDAEPTARKR